MPPLGLAFNGLEYCLLRAIEDWKEKNCKEEDNQAQLAFKWLIGLMMEWNANINFLSLTMIVRSESCENYIENCCEKHKKFGSIFWWNFCGPAAIHRRLRGSTAAANNFLPSIPFPFPSLFFLHFVVPVSVADLSICFCLQTFLSSTCLLFPSFGPNILLRL
jgi:hypothetical protein